MLQLYNMVCFLILEVAPGLTLLGSLSFLHNLCVFYWSRTRGHFVFFPYERLSELVGLHQWPYKCLHCRFSLVIGTEGLLLTELVLLQCILVASYFERCASDIYYDMCS